MKSQRTIQCERRRNLFAIISFVLLIGICATYVVIGVVSGKDGSSESNELKTKIGTIAYSAGLALIGLSVLLVIVGHKIRTTIWMVSVALGTYLFSTTGMWVTFVIWIVDEYVFFNLYTYYKNKVSINKEIDKRG